MSLATYVHTYIHKEYLYSAYYPTVRVYALQSLNKKVFSCRLKVLGVLFLYLKLLLLYVLHIVWNKEKLPRTTFINKSLVLKMNKKSLTGGIFFSQFVPVMYQSLLWRHLANVKKSRFIADDVSRHFSYNFLIKNKKYKYKMFCFETTRNSVIFCQPIHIFVSNFCRKTARLWS